MFSPHPHSITPLSIQILLIQNQKTLQHYFEVVNEPRTLLFWAIQEGHLVTVVDSISRIEDAPLGSDSAVPHEFASSSGFTLSWNRLKPVRDNLSNNTVAVLSKIIQSGNEDLLEWMIQYLPHNSSEINQVFKKACENKGADVSMVQVLLNHGASAHSAEILDLYVVTPPPQKEHQN